MFVDVLAAVFHKPAEGARLFPEVPLKEFAKGHEWDAGQFHRGICRIVVDFITVCKGTAGLAGEPEIAQGLERFTDKDVGEDIRLPGEECHAGIHEGAHGLAAAGDGGHETDIRVFHNGTNLLEEEISSGFVISAGADIVEFAGKVGFWVCGGDDGDVVRGGTEQEFAGQVMAGFLERGAEGIPWGLVVQRRGG